METRIALDQSPGATLTLAAHAVRSSGKAKRWREKWNQRLTVAALVLSDGLLALLVWRCSVYVAGVWGQSPWGHGSLSEAAVATIMPSVAAWLGLRAILGLYPGYGMDRAEKLRRHTYSVLAAAAITAVFAVALHLQDVLSRMLLALGFLGILLLGPLVQYLTEQCMRMIGAWSKPIVVVGSGQAGAQITDLLKERWELGYSPVAVFDYRLDAIGESSPSQPEMDAVLGLVADLAREHHANTLAIAMPHTRREQVAVLVGWASNYFRHVMVVPNLTGITNSAVVARDLAGTFAVEIKHNLLNPWARRIKRALDLCVAGAGTLLITPLLLAIIVLIKLDSPGPALFVQKRPGLNGNMFRIYKFRTMYTDAEQRLAELWLQDPSLSEEFRRHGKLRDDPRVTRIGRLLRKTSLDELPQLWNVLKGDMSLVGPRPYLTSQTSQISGAEALIMRVPPGISGLWQVSGRSDTTLEHRVALDLYYLNNWSVWLDLVILARTVHIVAFSRGAY